MDGSSYISGSLFLYIYWPSFNAALTGSPTDYQRAICNTYLALAACSVTTFIVSTLVGHGKFEMEHIQNSTLAGGVGVGSICNMHITAGGALMVGKGAGFISVYGFSKFKPCLIRNCGVMDTCGVLHLHGFPGVYSGILSVFFAAIATEDTYTKAGLGTVFEARADGRGAIVQALFQLIALVVTVAVAFFVGMGTESLKQNRNMAMRYLCLLIFQLALIPFYFIFVRYDTDHLADFKGYEDTHVMIHVGFGFLMSFLKKYCYGALGINWLLAALVAQWSLITQGLMMHMKEATILLNKKLLLEADVMCASVLITFGALVGRASVGQLLFIAVVEAFIGSINLYFVTSVFQAADVGGAIAIHTYGAFFGIGVSAAWLWRRPAAGEPEYTTHPLEGATYVSDVTAMIGSMFLYIYWPSFNAALTGSPTDYQRAICNSYLALAACSVTTFIVSTFVSHGKFGMEHIQNSTLAGGVGVGAICNMHITAGGALMVGIGAAFLSVYGFSKFKPCLMRKCGVMDTCGVLHLHGFPGVYSGILSVFFAAIATEDTYSKAGLGTVFEARADGRGAIVQALFQLIALAVTVTVAFFVGMGTGFVSKMRIFRPVPIADQFNDERFWEMP